MATRGTDHSYQLPQLWPLTSDLGNPCCDPQFVGPDTGGERNAENLSGFSVTGLEHTYNFWENIPHLPIPLIVTIPKC